MKSGNQVRWSEIRRDDYQGHSLEMFYIIAEKTSTGWEFYERSSWELCWYLIPSTEALLKKAIAEISQQSKKQQKYKVMLQGA